MDLADGVLWPLATDPDRGRCAAQALELYLRLARLIIARAAAWPESERPVPEAAEGLARQLYEAIERRVDNPGRPPLAKCFTSPETVPTCVELLARLDGELPS